MATTHKPRATAEALQWLRETDTLTEKNIKRACWEDLRCVEIGPREIRVENHSHAEPAEHAHTVYVTDEIISSCSCAQFTYRHQVCKHMIRVALWFDEQ